MLDDWSSRFQVTISHKSYSWSCSHPSTCIDTHLGEAEAEGEGEDDDDDDDDDDEGGGEACECPLVVGQCSFTRARRMLIKPVITLPPRHESPCSARPRYDLTKGAISAIRPRYTRALFPLPSSGTFFFVSP